jgi:HEAT repeat protein
MSIFSRLLKLIFGPFLARNLPKLEELIGGGDIDGIMDLVQRVADKGLKIKAVEALGDLGDLKAQPILQQLLEDDDNAIRVAAQAALGKLVNK